MNAVLFIQGKPSATPIFQAPCRRLDTRATEALYKYLQLTTLTVMQLRLTRK